MINLGCLIHPDKARLFIIQKARKLPNFELAEFSELGQHR
jgi:hypothetical protein